MITLCPTCGRCSPTETSFGTCRCPSARVQHQLLHQFTGLLNVQSGTCYAGTFPTVCATFCTSPCAAPILRGWQHLQHKESGTCIALHMLLPSQMGAAHGVVLEAENAHVTHLTVLHMLPLSQTGATHGVALRVTLTVGQSST